MYSIRLSLSRLLLVVLGSSLLVACATAHQDELSETSVSSQIFLKGKPGSISTSVTTVKADVIAIDYKKRDVTLQDAQGNKRTLNIDEEASNFSQVNVGDHMVLQIASEIDVFLLTDTSNAIDADRTVDLKAPQGEKPAFLVAESSKIQAVITAVDSATRMATLTFDDGSTDSFVVRPDVELSEKLVGQTIVIIFTDAIALSVTAQ